MDKVWTFNWGVFWGFLVAFLAVDLVHWIFRIIVEEFLR